MKGSPECEACTTPSKRPVGYWDGDDGHGGLTGGILYDCSDQTCPIAQERAAAARAAAEQRQRTAEENERNGVDPPELKGSRIAAGITLKGMTRLLGGDITPALLCAYELGRKPIPPDLYQRAMEILDRKLGGRP